MWKRIWTWEYEILKCILQELQDQNQPQVEKIVYCNEETNTHWVKVCTYSWDPVTQTHIENVMSETDTWRPCDLEAPTVDIERVQVCDPVTNTLHEKVYAYVTVYDNEDVDDSTPTTTENLLNDIDLWIPCWCDPAIVDLTADDLSWAISFNTMGISKPECCEATIVTSAGTFTLPKWKFGIDMWPFGCPIDLVSVTSTDGDGGNCNDQIHIILTRN